MARNAHSMSTPIDRGSYYEVKMSHKDRSKMYFYGQNITHKVSFLQECCICLKIKTSNYNFSLLLNLN